MTAWWRRPASIVLTATSLAVLAGASGCAATGSTSLDRAIASYDAGDYDGSYQRAQAARATGSTRARAEAAYVAGLAAVRLDRNATARPLLEQAVASGSPKVAGQAGVTLGTLLLDDREPLAAARAFDAASEHLQGESLARARMLAGVAYRDAGRAAEARDRFDRAARTTDGSTGSRAALEISRTGFTIQCGAFRTREAAVSHAATVSTAAAARGMPKASVVRLDRAGSVRWVVRLGHYPDRSIAQSQLDRLGGGLGKPFIAAISTGD